MAIGNLPNDGRPQIGRRRDSRLRLEVPGRLILLGGECRVSVCDLSQSGARLRAKDAVKAGEEGFLRWLDFETFGRAVWSRGGFVGMEFEKLLPSRVLLKTRERLDRGLVPDEERIALERARAWYQGYR